MNTPRITTSTDPRPVHGLHHFAWRCRDAEQTRRFYEDVLGLPLVHVIRKDHVPSTGEYCPYVHIFFRMVDGSHIAFFDLGDHTAAEPSPNTPGWVNHIALRVASTDDLDLMRMRLRDHGVDVIGVVDHDGYIHSIYFFDPNGLRLELTVEVAEPQAVARFATDAHADLNAWTAEKKVAMAMHDLRLATRADGTRDGQLVLVDRSLSRCVPVPGIAPTLQAALDDWACKAPQLADARARMDASGWHGAEPFDARACLAPLPRAYQWADASVYRNHARLIYQWRKEPIPPRYEEEPLVYQGGSDVMLGCSHDIVAVDEAHGIDLEAEIAVVTTDVPMGVSADDAVDHIALVVLLNDVSLRGLIPSELARGFGFYQSKPATSFAPVALTPAALGAAWRGAMAHLAVNIEINGRWFGNPDAGEETVFHFGHILAHLARTRSLAAGSIVGAGTISNADPRRGSACITEARVRQMLDGAPESELQPYLKNGDRVRIEARTAEGEPLFGAIDQRVVIG